MILAPDTKPLTYLLIETAACEVDNLTLVLALIELLTAQHSVMCWEHCIL